MSDVFREQSFRFQGRDLTVVPSLALLRRIKARGVNNVALANKCIRGGVDLEDLAAVLFEFLRAAQVPEGEERPAVSEDESYAFLIDGNQTEIAGFKMAYVQAVLPTVDMGKKPAAPGKKGRKKARPTKAS
ncbi:hypothetical protein [Rhodovulum sulfidophilum]|uniref:hypothetical protein n=1 Tax=Rhodovulum sulfidophilum TaxID=35806 RepID=UPI001F2F7079|nr:hypothetical protein [Rhodovulum sulfidophilum]MCE8440044.1 hypothetical protein [Rhodovulum sulfidophilum]MCE8468885.1 hypothetical protein [Rhodovulum sulfidophilum]